MAKRIFESFLAGVAMKFGMMFSERYLGPYFQPVRCPKCEARDRIRGVK